MGHLRLGRLPKHRNWQRVIALLDLDPADAHYVARATVAAADSHLKNLGSNGASAYCFWLLVQIASASRYDDMSERLHQLGISISSEDALLTLISRVSDQARTEIRSRHDSDGLSEIAALSLRVALAETVGIQGPSMFESSISDFSRACRVYSTRKHFGTLAKIFFGDFLGRTIKFIIDREIANHVGSGRGIRNVLECRTFVESVDLFSRQSARIVEDFAGGWFSKHEWESAGHISREDAGRFVAFAMKKIRADLALERAQV